MVLRRPVVHLLVSPQVQTPCSDVTCIAPQAEKIRLELITTSEISTIFMGVPVTFKQVFTEMPKISNKFSREQTGVP